MSVQRIFIPTDFSPHSEHALEVAFEMASAFGARLQVFHCFQEVKGAQAPVGSAGLDPAIRDSAEDALNQQLKRFDSYGVDVDLDLQPGMFPATALLDAARKSTADLIVLGTHGRSGLKRVLLGSVAEEVVREATCPVVMVKAP
jgi:nucleotide-binding universal stress UspA family protein